MCVILLDIAKARAIEFFLPIYVPPAKYESCYFSTSIAKFILLLSWPV